MIQYYRVVESGEKAQEGDNIHDDGSHYRPTEMDEWHPASKPPKPEDFEPTGWIHAIDDKGNHHRLTQQELAEWSEVTTYIYWRRISLPENCPAPPTT